MRNLSGPIFVNLVLFVFCTFIGSSLLYLLWAGAYLTTFSVFLRLRGIAEHACTPNKNDPLQNTRTTYANLLAKLTVAPHNINYHLEHHLMMSVPHYHLPAFHEALKKSEKFQKACIEKGYLPVLLKAAGTKVC